jgi:hypothetical protein
VTDEMENAMQEPDGVIHEDGAPEGETPEGDPDPDEIER